MAGVPVHQSVSVISNDWKGSENPFSFIPMIGKRYFAGGADAFRTAVRRNARPSSEKYIPTILLIWTSLIHGRHKFLVSSEKGPYL